MHLILMSLLSNHLQLDSDSNFKQLGIEMFAIISNNGRMIHSEKFETLSIEHDKKEMFLMELALQHSMLRDFDEDLGDVNYCVTHRKNRKFFSIPTVNNNTILVVAQEKSEHEPMEECISELLKYSRQLLGESGSKGSS